MTAEKRGQSDAKGESKAGVSGRGRLRKRSTGARGLRQSVCESVVRKRGQVENPAVKIDVKSKEGTLKRNTESATVISTLKLNLGKIVDFSKA